jgi:hypothetical protein
MWVKIQDGKTVIEINCFNTRKEEDKYIIRGLRVADNRWYRLAAYSSEGKALDVFELMQVFINKCKTFELNKNFSSKFSSFIFEMPKESSV